MTSAAFTDILCASSATVIVSGIVTSRMTGAAAPCAAPSPPSSSWRRRRRPSAAASPAAAVPPVTSPRSLSARRRAASSWNTCPGAFFVGSSRFSPGFAAGRCSVPSVGVFAAAAFPASAVSATFAASAAAAASASAAALAAASSASRSFFVLRLASCSCFFCTSSCWRAISSCALLLLGFARGDLLGAEQHAARRRRPSAGFLDDAGAARASSSSRRSTKHALLAHLDLDRARLAGRVGGLDLGRLLARQRDALLRLAAAPCCLRR